jgi:broad specificity phosphatase PhoE
VYRLRLRFYPTDHIYRPELFGHHGHQLVGVGVLIDEPFFILVRHSLTQIDPTRPANQWELSDEGRRRCIVLAQQLLPYKPDLVVTSVENKALETGRILGKELDIAYKTAPGLHEHERSKTGVMGIEQFHKTIADFFAQPNVLIFGDETAEKAKQRFTLAVQNVLSAHPQENIAIVAHGTVITLLASELINEEPFPFWERLGLPAFLVFSRGENRLLAQVNTIT